MDELEYKRQERWARRNHSAEAIARQFYNFALYRLVSAEDKLGAYEEELQSAYTTWASTIELPCSKWRGGWVAFTDLLKKS